MSDIKLKVLNNCDLGGCAAKNQKSVCPTCIHWKPTSGSRYYSCNQWWTSRIPCNLPRSSCPTCPHHIPKGTIPVGRPATTGMDWSDPIAVAEYNREAKRKSRKKRGNSASQS